MKLKMFSVYDSKAEAYMQPFFMQTKGQAIRAFSDACNDPKTQFYKHPADFTLFEIGEYDDQDAVVSQSLTKAPLGTALEFLSRSPEVTQ